MFSGSSYSIRIVVMLYDQTGSSRKWKSKMATKYRKMLSEMFDINSNSKIQNGGLNPKISITIEQTRFETSSYCIQSFRGRFLGFSTSVIFQIAYTVLIIVPLDTWTSKTYIWFLEFRCYVIYNLRYMYSKFRGRHLRFSASGYSLTWDYHRYNTSGMSIAENVGVAVRSLFPTTVYYILYNVHILYLLLPVLCCHFSWKVEDISDIFLARRIAGILGESHQSA